MLGARRIAIRLLLACLEFFLRCRLVEILRQRINVVLLWHLMLPLDRFLLLVLLIAQFVDLNFGLLDGALRGERLLLL